MHLLDTLGIIRELARGKDLHLVPALRVLLHFLREQFGGFLPRAAGLIGVTELEDRLRGDTTRPQRSDSEHDGSLFYEVATLHGYLLGERAPRGAAFTFSTSRNALVDPGARILDDLVPFADVGIDEKRQTPWDGAMSVIR
ncbi:MAG: hypothetical protein WKH97_13785 [Casimicrobiaceae bacterium]